VCSDRLSIQTIVASVPFGRNLRCKFLLEGCELLVWGSGGRNPYRESEMGPLTSLPGVDRL